MGVLLLIVDALVVGKGLYYIVCVQCVCVLFFIFHIWFLQRQELEAQSVVPAGSTRLTQKESALSKKGSWKFALGSVTGLVLSEFVPEPAPGTCPNMDINFLETQKVLITVPFLQLEISNICRNNHSTLQTTNHQFLNGSKELKWSELCFDFAVWIFNRRQKAENVLVYTGKRPILRKREEHHRLTHDADNALKACGWWGLVFTKVIPLFQNGSVQFHFLTVLVGLSSCLPEESWRVFGMWSGPAGGLLIVMNWQASLLK